MSTYNYLDKAGLSIVWDKVKNKISNAISGLVTGPSSAVSGNVAVFNGTTGKTIKDSGFTIGKSVPSNAVFTDTDTKVTSAANHYTPATASGSDKAASASGATAAWGIDVVKGLTINTDGKGHITGLSVTSGKIPANPNAVTNVAYDSTNKKLTKTINGSTTDVVTVATLKTAIGTATTTEDGLMAWGDKTKLNGIASGAEVNQNAFSTIKVGSSSIAADAKSDTINIVAGSNVTITADITNDKLTFAATNTTYTAATTAPPNINTSGAVGSSTNYARQDHTHAITLASGDSNGQIKIAGTNVSVKGLGTAAYTSSELYSTATNWTNGTGTRSVKLGGVASGNYSVAEGVDTEASGDGSHAEGEASYASGECSHAEGQSNAEGTYSHAEGLGTVANHRSQHVFGEYNTEDVNANAATARGTYVEMVGNGTGLRNRANARTLDWSGNEVLSGSMTVGAKIKLQYNSTTEALDFIFV